MCIRDRNCTLQVINNSGKYSLLVNRLIALRVQCSDPLHSSFLLLYQHLRQPISSMNFLAYFGMFFQCTLFLLQFLPVWFLIKHSYLTICTINKCLQGFVFFHNEFYSLALRGTCLFVTLSLEIILIIIPTSPLSLIHI